MGVLVIDNYDSFTFNLVQYLGELGAEPDGGAQRRRNRRRAAGDAAPDRVIVSPGPVHPGRGGRVGGGDPALRRGAACPCSGCAWATRRWPRRSAARWFAASRCTARRPRSTTTGGPSSRASRSPLAAGRYHSLVVDPDLPDELERSAHLGDTVMGMRHRELPAEGVQFHPESVLTGDGKAILRNFLSR